MVFIRYCRYRLGTSEVSTIKSFEFFRDLYRYLVKQENQGVFIINFFIAGGSSYFTLPKSKTHRTTSYLENERHYAKDRVLTPEMKASFPKPVKVDELKNFLEKNLDSDKVRDCMSSFGVPASYELNKHYLARALAVQFQMFIVRGDDDVDNVIISEYQRQVLGVEDEPNMFYGPLNNGDDVWVEDKGRNHKAKCYETFEHTWVIHNSGHQSWYSRKLVFVNAADVRPSASETEIEIPETAPGEIIKITTSFYARGFEGKFDCIWEMQDCDGNNCFPNYRWIFNVAIDTIFEA